jgi:uncharacterized protein (DUF4415 family)
MQKEGGAMPTTKASDFDYQAYMRQHAPQPEAIRRGPAERDQRREVAKHKITIRIDADILEQFKHLVPQGQGYQSLMNQALREWLLAKGVTELVREELQALTAQMKASLQEASRRA